MGLPPPQGEAQKRIIIYSGGYVISDRSIRGITRELARALEASDRDSARPTLGRWLQDEAEPGDNVANHQIVVRRGC